MTGFTEYEFTLPDVNNKEHTVKLVPALGDIITSHPISLKINTYLDDIFDSERIPLPPNGWSKPIDWFTNSGMRLALVQLDARFGEGGEWYDLLPPEIRDAPGIKIEEENPNDFSDLDDEAKAMIVY